MEDGHFLNEAVHGPPRQHGAGALLLDVRIPDEFKDGSYDGAINIPLAALLARQEELGPKNNPVVLF